MPRRRYDRDFGQTLWIDSDILFQADDVDRLVSVKNVELPEGGGDPEHELPGVISGVYVKKGMRELACRIPPEIDKVVFGVGGGFIPILHAGCGMLLVRKWVYESVQQKWNLELCNQNHQGGLLPFFQPMIVNYRRRPAIPVRGLRLLRANPRLRYPDLGRHPDAALSHRHVWIQLGGRRQRPRAVWDVQFQRQAHVVENVLMNWRIGLVCASLAVAWNGSDIAGAAEAPSKAEAEAALRKSVGFFREKVAASGGYLYRYSEDLAAARGRREGDGDDGLGAAAGNAERGGSVLARV